MISKIKVTSSDYDPAIGRATHDPTLEMPMSKHTPGPWHTNPDSDLRRIGVYAGSEEEIVICDVTDEDLEHDLEIEANAALIVAAPDLLAVCKAVVEEDGFRGSALMRKRIDEMTAAIAKAEGRS